MTYPKRIIEVDLPIARISAHARREKSIRHGHVSTPRIWWARRPLAACRAVICAPLWCTWVESTASLVTSDAGHGQAQTQCRPRAIGWNSDLSDVDRESRTSGARFRVECLIFWLHQSLPAAHGSESASIGTQNLDLISRRVHPRHMVAILCGAT